jgi:hypothetical protein
MTRPPAKVPGWLKRNWLLLLAAVPLVMFLFVLARILAGPQLQDTYFSYQVR